MHIPVAVKQHISYVNFQSVDPIIPLNVSAQLRVPTIDAAEKIPAVVIVHGSCGVDGRGNFYGEALNDAGIATLEIDMWAARGWLGGISGRPRGVPETLPTPTALSSSFPISRASTLNVSASWASPGAES